MNPQLLVEILILIYPQTNELKDLIITGLEKLEEPPFLRNTGKLC